MTGWLLPSREFIACATFAHLDVVSENSKLRKLVPNADKIFSDLEEIEQGCEDLMDDGEHPEWHVYEMARDDAVYEIREKLLEAGCFRVGKMGSRLFFEGKPDPMLMQYAKDFAESHGFTAEFDLC